MALLIKLAFAALVLSVASAARKSKSDDAAGSGDKTYAELWRDEQVVPPIPEGFIRLKTKEPRIRPPEGGKLQVPSGFELIWEVSGYGRTASLAPYGTKALKEAEKEGDTPKIEASPSRHGGSRSPSPGKAEKNTSEDRRSSSKEANKGARSPSPPSGRNVVPDFWRNKAVTTAYDKNKPWWIKPNNGFKLNLDLGKSKAGKISEIFGNRDLKTAQIFEVDDQVIKTSFKDDGIGNEVPNEKDIASACRFEVCNLSLEQSGVLLIGDEILQPVPYAGPEKEYEGKKKGTFFIKNGQTLRRYCPADTTRVTEYTCKNGVLLGKGNKKVQNGKDLVCDSEYMPQIFYHKKQCNKLDPDSVMLYSGYIIPSEKNPQTPLYYPLIDICWNVPNAMPYWTKIRVHGRNAVSKCASRVGDFVAPPSGIYAKDILQTFLPANKYKAYEELIGVSRAFKFLGGVDRGHFTALMDAVYFAWQLLTNEYMNQSPQHAHINEGNHMFLEKTMRGLIARIHEVFYIVTGPIGYVRKENVSLEKFRGEMTKEEQQKYDAAKKGKDGDKIFYLDYENQQVPFNMYYAKVLYSPGRKTGMAFITSNLPIEHDIDKLCSDVCDEYGWLNSVDRFNFEKGFAYCCKLDEFFNRFPYFAESLAGSLPKKLEDITPMPYKVFKD